MCCQNSATELSAGVATRLKLSFSNTSPAECQKHSALKGATRHKCLEAFTKITSVQTWRLNTFCFSVNLLICVCVFGMDWRGLWQAQLLAMLLLGLGHFFQLSEKNTMDSPDLLINREVWNQCCHHLIIAYPLFRWKMRLVRMSSYKNSI